MKKYKFMLFIIIFIIISLVICFLYVNNKNNENSKKCMYQISYFDTLDLKHNYHICFFKDNKIKVMKYENCSMEDTEECQDNNANNLKDEYFINFSNKNIILIWKWIDKIFANQVIKEKDYNSSNINDYDRIIIESLVTNEEKNLNLLDNNDNIIYFEDYKLDKNILELIEGKSFKLSIDDENIVYINGKKTNIVNGNFYVVDIDKDNVKEIIVSNMDEELISPITNNYYIYKYNESYDSFEEIVAIKIDGKIDSFYVNGPIIKVLYYPFQGKKGYIEEKKYEFISNDYEIMIFPSYLNQLANSLTIYNQMFLITKTYSDNGNKDLIYEIGNHKIIVDDIKEMLLNEITNPKDCIDFYRIKLKNDSNSYYLCENSEFMENVINNLNYDGKIWYVND